MVGEEEDVKRLFDYINILNPAIEFTYEVSKDSIDFLDVTIHLNPHGRKLDFELYIKPTSKGIFLNYNSHHAKSVILNSAKNEFRRAVTYGTSEQLIQNGVKKIRTMLLDNEYPEEVLDKALSEVRYGLQNPRDGGSERDDVSLPTIHQRGTLQTNLLYIEKKQFVKKHESNF